MRNRENGERQEAFIKDGQKERRPQIVEYGTVIEGESRKRIREDEILNRITAKSSKSTVETKDAIYVVREC